jgi:hypothetical protein
MYLEGGGGGGGGGASILDSQVSQFKTALKPAGVYRDEDKG